MNSEQAHAAIQAALPSRRSQVVRIGAQMFRVREPEPTRSFRVLAYVTPLLGPTLIKILSGQAKQWKKACCPQCGADEKQDINGQWLCTSPAQEGRVCGTVFAKKQDVDEKGQPVVLTIGYMLERQEWRAFIALQIEQAVDRLDPQTATPLMHEILDGHVDMGMAGDHWIEIQNLNDRVPNGMALILLVKAAMEAWILPSLVDDYSAMTPVSSTIRSKGDQTMEPGKPSTDAASLVLPGPLPAGTRAPPPVLRRG